MKMVKLSLMVIVFVLLLVGGRAWAETQSNAAAVDVFSDSLNVEGKYTYAYPESASSITKVTTEKHSGDASLMIKLDPKTYSGAAIGTYPLADLASIRQTGAIEFWIKGAKGGEKCEITLLDSDDSDKTKCEVGVEMTPKYVNITTDWQKVTVPLSAFPDQGQYWDGSGVKPDAFDWNELKEVKFDIRPSDANAEFTVYLDDVKIVKSFTKEPESKETGTAEW